MKKFLLILAFIILSGCRGLNYFDSEVSRNQIYYGQSVANLFDNFGTPKKLERYNNGVYAYIFMQEEIIRKNVDNYFKYCNLRVFTQNNRVIDWQWQGNNCQFTVDEETKLTLFDDEEPIED